MGSAVARVSQRVRVSTKLSSLRSVRVVALSLLGPASVQGPTQGNSRILRKMLHTMGSARDLDIGVQAIAHT